MAAVVLHVVQRGLITMKYRMLAVVERLLGLMTGPDVVFSAAVRSSLRVMSTGGVVMLGSDSMMRRPVEVCWRTHGSRLRTARRPREITRQWTAVLLGVTRARRLPMLQRAKRVPMSRHSLMCGFCVAPANLVVPRRLAMKMGRPFVMDRCCLMVVRGVVCGSHEHPSVCGFHRRNYYLEISSHRAGKYPLTYDLPCAAASNATPSVLVTKGDSSDKAAAMASSTRSSQTNSSFERVSSGISS